MAFISIFTFASPKVAAQNGTIPIPQKRPNVMMASPDFIAKITGQKRVITTIDKTDLQDSVQELSVADILNVLEPAAGIAQDIEKQPKADDKKTTSINFSSIPQHKPPHKNKDASTTFVSFTLEPTQTSLNSALKDFLSDHAVSLLNEKLTQTLDIQAYTYSTSKENQSQTARIGLARSLDIRRFLVQKGIRPERIKISPIHAQQNESIDHRIDLVFSDSSD